ncbi:MAG: sodium/glutamate symporter [Gammaproteobacteria bacterium]|jgi:glutamate:Na+ symporter, ESS family|nr:sodium/glutamate symporter [Gammaproteobacteria bacterium]MBU0826741.1 sodium/glutamate symporter [Gammaproteobacteria bacterium]MBU0893527.1 sodium/glutamate symporter [Gammaproteobacteria bacterium]MBU1819317.1 sodium/glutamate symporter [Gammaproteobacteria bacterium]
MVTIQLDIAQTIGIAAVLLVVGEFVKKRVGVLSRYFIPGPIIGGLLFSLIALVGHQANWFTFQFYDTMRAFLLLVFFTTIGFSASFELLKKGGVGVALFLGAAVGLVVLQNMLGAGLAAALGVHPLIGVAAGSVSLTGGHGTSAAFGPLLEQAGAAGALPAAIAAATYGLVAGCVIGGPLGTLLMRRNGLRAPGTAGARNTAVGTGALPAQMPDTASVPRSGSNDTVMYASILIAISIGAGTLLVNWLKDLGLTLPSYLGPMLVAALVRNIIDWRDGELPLRQFEVVGNVSLAFFLAMALMSMKLWELAEVAGPLLVVLVAQTALMFGFAYFVTFRVMGRDYDAAVIAAGHCGFGMGATPNAMANMQAFTAVNGPSVKAFFVIPLVGSLFIDFFNAVIITGFMNYLK